jgi:hypothetical protein
MGHFANALAVENVELVNASAIGDPPDPFDLESLWMNEAPSHHAYTDALGGEEVSLVPNYLQLQPAGAIYGGTSHLVAFSFSFPILPLLHSLASGFLPHHRPARLAAYHTTVSFSCISPCISIAHLDLTGPNGTTTQETRKARRCSIEKKSRDKRVNAIEMLKMFNEVVGKSYNGKKYQIAVLKDTYELLV